MRAFLKGFCIVFLWSCGADPGGDRGTGGAGGATVDAGAMGGASSGGSAGAPGTVDATTVVAAGGAVTVTTPTGGAQATVDGGYGTGGTRAAAGGSIGTGGTSSQCPREPSTTDAGADTETRPPSCSGLADTCGPCQDENCCTSLLVPGGSFLRSYDGDVYVEQTWPASVSDFRLDRFEVTVGRFRRFVDAVLGGWRPTKGAGKHTHLNGGAGIAGESGWSTDWTSWIPSTKTSWEGTSHLACDAELSTWTPEPGTKENQAITCVTWVEAYAFCIWDGGFLPTEAEWNYAAAGGDEQRPYPWGSAPPNANLAVYYCRDGGTPGCAWPVGSRPAGDGRWGQADLAGNRWEWTLDSANELKVSWGTCAAGTPCTSYPTTNCVDCGYFQETFNRIDRGGSNTDAPKNVRAALRDESSFLDVQNDLGMRCARIP